MYCLNMLAIALELAKEDAAYEDVASKFFEHFVYICRAMNNIGGEGIELWNREDGFFYDVLDLPDGRRFPMKVRSMVGLIPLFGVETLDSDVVDRLPGFKRRMQWFLENRPDFAQHVETETTADGRGAAVLLARQPAPPEADLPVSPRRERVPFTARRARGLPAPPGPPVRLDVMGIEHRVDYEPAESSTGLFGGNSNWRGPVWFPVNYLIIESLQKFHFYPGRRVQGRVSVRLGVDAEPLGRGRGAVPPTEPHLPARRGRAEAGLRRRAEAPDRPALPGPRPLLRVLPRRQRRRPRARATRPGWTGLVAKLIQQSGQ